MSEVMDGELTYDEVVETRIVIAVNAYRDELSSVLRNIELRMEDVLSNSVISDLFFTREDVGVETMRIVSNATIAINKRIAELNK